MPVGGDLAPEVGRAGEGFAVEELVFDEAMDGFDVTLPGVTLGWDVAVIRTEGADGGGEALLGLVFEELTTVIGLPGEAGEIHAVAGEVDGELFGQEGGVRLGEFVGIAGETSAGDGFAGGVLEAGEFEAGHLRPIVRNVLQILGVGGELAEEGPEAFDLAELFFGGGFLFAGASEFVVADDTGDGVVTDGEVELLFETLGAEGGLLAELDDLTFEAAGGLVRAMMGSAGAFLQCGGFAGHVAAQPFADGVAGAAELASGGLETVGAGKGDELVDWMKTLPTPSRRHIEQIVRNATPDYQPRDSERLQNDLMTWEELQSLDPALITLGAHSTNHPILANCTPSELIEEIQNGRVLLERKLGRPVEFFCYPNGDFNPAVVKFAARTYSAAVTTRSGFVRPGVDLHQLPRLNTAHTLPHFTWRLFRPSA